MDNSTLCYIEKDGQYLMLHRVKKEHDINEGKWIGVGGHLEEGESPLDCVIRETFEETGLKLINPRYRGLVTFVSRSGGKLYTEQMHLFTCAEFSGELVSDCDEGVLKWVKKEDVPALPLWEGDRIFLRLLGEEERFFLLKLEYSDDALVNAETVVAGA